jgi:hypothetical protein
MVAITYGVARGAARKVCAASKANIATAKGTGFFARLYQGLIDARMRQAYRELALHRHLLSDGSGDLPELRFRGR